MKKDKIAEALGINDMVNVKPEIPQKSEMVSIVHDVEAQGDDFASVQKQIRQIAQLGSEKLRELGDVASLTQHPRAYEAFTELLKAALQAQRELLEIQRTQLDIENKKPNFGVDEKKIVNNNLFVGSTRELLEQMKVLNEKK